MAPDTVMRLFQPFMQADQSLDRSKGGLGLGLALIKGLVELHGGSIQAQSDGLGKGAAFVIRLHSMPELCWRSPPTRERRTSLPACPDHRRQLRRGGELA